MEHRCFTRYPRQLTVVLWDRDERLGAFETRNVSREGLCLALGKNDHAALGHREVVDVQLYSARPFGPAQLLRALIVHRSDGALGLLCTPDIDDSHL